MPKVPLVSIIIVSFNTRELLGECLNSTYQDADDSFVEVRVVDNASSDGSVEMVRREFPKVKVIANEHNVGFARANNQMLAQAKGDFLLLLNSDAMLLPGCLTAMLRAFDEHPMLGICGPRLLNTDGSIQPSWGDFPTPTTELLFQSFLYKFLPCRFPYGRRVHPLFLSAYDRFQWVDWVTGAALMLKRDVMAKVGGLPDNNFMYGEDLEYCARAQQAGFRVAYLPQSKVIHHLNVSSRRDYSRWIENYTHATLLYYELYKTLADQKLVSYLIIVGSQLRQVIWDLVGMMSASKREEARSRREGYSRAVALARRNLNRISSSGSASS